MDDQKLADILIRHALGAEKLSKGMADKLVRLLNAGDEDLLSQLAARYALIETTGYDRGPKQTQRLEDLLQAIRAVNSQVYQKIADEAKILLVDSAGHEIDFANAAIAKAGGSISTDTTLHSTDFLVNLVETSPITGHLFKTWTDDLESKRFMNLEGVLRTAFTNRDSIDSIIAKIRGTRAKLYKDGILNISRNSAQTFAITANSTVQNNARLETFKRQASTNYVEWSAILDSRTSTICQSLSGQIWPIDAAHPTPPAHMRCRSILLPRKNNTDPPLHKPYSEWLTGQSDKVQDTVLGQQRGQLFRDGKVKSDDLYRNDGSFKTLEELKAHDASILED